MNMGAECTPEHQRWELPYLLVIATTSFFDKKLSGLAKCLSDRQKDGLERENWAGKCRTWAVLKRKG
jgi:hypothetical protein